MEQRAEDIRGTIRRAESSWYKIGRVTCQCCSFTGCGGTPNLAILTSRNRRRSTATTLPFSAQPDVPHNWSLTVAGARANHPHRTPYRPRPDNVRGTPMNDCQKSWTVERKRRRGTHRAARFVEKREFIYLLLTVTALQCLAGGVSDVGFCASSSASSASELVYEINGPKIAPVRRRVGEGA